MDEVLIRGRTLSFLRWPDTIGDHSAYAFEEDGGILIRDGRIVATGSYAEVARQAGDAAQKIDHRPHLLLPGFIDAHVHFPQMQVIASYGAAYERIQRGTSIASDKLYHLESSEKDQVSGTYFDITKNTVQAARETEGEILVGPSGKIAPAFFHAKCGGKTLRPDQVWGGVEEGYRSVNCTFCSKTGNKDWKYQLKGPKLTQMVDQVLKRYYADGVQGTDVKVMQDSVHNSELRLYVGDRLHIIKKAYLRNTAGRELLPSNNYTLVKKNNEFVVEGQGNGHGVGLCQLGALELAKRGYDYRQILSFYFPRHKMKKVY